MNFAHSCNKADPVMNIKQYRRLMLTQPCRQLFSFASDVVYIDHGGYGVTPSEVQAFRSSAQEKIEASPRAFFDIECRAAWTAATAVVAKRFSAQAEDMALVENVTDGINAVLRSLSFQPGDEILITSMTYGAIAMAVEHIVRKDGAHVIYARLPFPSPNREQCIEAIKAALSVRTRLAIIDHITSNTALVLPIIEMARLCRENGTAVLVDGAHAPGHVPLDIASIHPDWYVGNLHKWSFVPRGCGFLWANRKRQKHLMPTVISWGADEPFPHSFWWTGTRDPSNWMSISAAFEFMDRFGEENVRQHNHSLVRDASRFLTKAWGVRREVPDDMTGAMTLIPLPESPVFIATEDGRATIQRTLWDSFKIACPCILFEGRLYVRISAQIYNEMDDYERLGHAVNVMARQSVHFPVL